VFQTTAVAYATETGKHTNSKASKKYWLRIGNTKNYVSFVT